MATTTQEKQPKPENGTRSLDSRISWCCGCWLQPKVVAAATTAATPHIQLKSWRADAGWAAAASRHNRQPLERHVDSRTVLRGPGSYLSQRRARHVEAPGAATINGNAKIEPSRSAPAICWFDYGSLCTQPLAIWRAHENSADSSLARPALARRVLGRTDGLTEYPVGLQATLPTPNPQQPTTTTSLQRHSSPSPLLLLCCATTAVKQRGDSNGFCARTSERTNDI